MEVYPLICNVNIGLLTGKLNNIIVLDVDEKDNGIEEFKLYIAEYGEPMTVKKKTPNNGYHYIFEYSHSDPDMQFLIDNSLTNSSKYRGVGLDIRTNGGFIVI